MQAFEFATAGRIVFGAGRAAEVPAILGGLGGNRVFVCTGARPERHADLLGALPPDTRVYQVDGEPTVEVARAATAAAREHRAGVVLGIGGGSVLDLGKAVAMLLGNGGDPLDYLEVVGRGQPIRRAGTPYVAVPTTSGTGAEVTANAVLASPGHGVKASLRAPSMLPRVAVVDPLLAVGCPPAVTASSGLDALTQCLEPLVSVRANPMTDGMAREGLRRAASGLRRSYVDGGDVAARTDMALCSLFGGLALANGKLGAVHGLAGVLGGMLPVPHGVACAALLAPVTEVNLAALRSRQPDAPALLRYAEAARLLTGRPEASTADGVAWLRETVAALDIPPLRRYGLRAEHTAEVVAKAARASSTRGNPIPLEPDELESALAGAT